MKKLLTSLMVFAMALSVITFTPNAVQAKRFKQHLTANLKSISVSWSKVKGAQKYVVYRAKVKRSEETPKKSKLPIIIIAAVVLLVAVGGLTAFLIISNQNKTDDSGKVADDGSGGKVIGPDVKFEDLTKEQAIEYYVDYHLNHHPQYNFGY